MQNTENFEGLISLIDPGREERKALEAKADYELKLAQAGALSSMSFGDKGGMGTGAIIAIVVIIAILIGGGIFLLKRKK